MTSLRSALSDAVKANVKPYEFNPNQKSTKLNSFLGHFSLRFRAAANKPLTRTFVATYTVTSAVKQAFLGAFLGAFKWAVAGTLAGAVGGALLTIPLGGVGAGFGAAAGAAGGAIIGSIRGSIRGTFNGAATAAVKLHRYKVDYQEHKKTGVNLDASTMRQQSFDSQEVKPSPADLTSNFANNAFA